MSGIFIYSEDGAVARQLVTAGLGLKESMNQPVVAIALPGADTQALAATGVDKVVQLKGDNAWPESYAGAICDYLAAEGASVVLVGGTARGKDVAARIAARLGAGLVTDAQSLCFTEGAIETTRMMYGGLALCTERVSLPALVTVPPRGFEEAPEGQGAAELVTVEAAADERVAISDICPTERQGVDISAAERIVCVGRGLAKREDMALAEALAASLGAELACSRGIAEDYHWLPVERYIGISGQKVKPELYLSVGVSGQVQHVAGIRDSRIIVAIDSNEKAPIFQAADYGIVGDLYDIVPLLASALARKAA